MLVHAATQVSDPGDTVQPALVPPLKVGMQRCGALMSVGAPGAHPELAAAVLVGDQPHDQQRVLCRRHGLEASDWTVQ